MLSKSALVAPIFTATAKPYTKHSAIVGLTKWQKPLLEAIDRLTSFGSRPFDTIDEAKDWLAEQVLMGNRPAAQESVRGERGSLFTKLGRKADRL